MVYWISEQYLKTQTVITANVDATMIIPLTQVASDLYVAPILHDEYYTYLLAAYNAGTLTALENTLVTYIRPLMAWRAAEMALGVSAAVFSNKGPQSQSGEYSANSEFNTLNYVRNEYRNFAEVYEDNLIKYLKENKASYPGYIAASNNDTCDDAGTDSDMIMII